jgi:small nuclear ribonucleoprotein (snRNP)-like protein
MTSPADTPAVIDKVVDKMVRISITDGREYIGKLILIFNERLLKLNFIGKLMCVDKTKAVFLQDALEILDKSAPEYLDHDLYTPYLIKNHDKP